VPRAPLALAVPAVLAAAVAGCGGQGGTGGQRRPPSVRLQVTAPADAALTRQASVEVSGSVSPARARVLVAGRPVKVDGGAFRATVPLREGANVIDVGAAAARATGAWVALRVTRETLVTVPSLTGASREEAVTALEARGLRPNVSDQDGFLDKLLPGEQQVCETRPAAGADVRAGSAVDVLVAKGC
jgi:Glucodextranase, domain B/PASTA domain